MTDVTFHSKDLADTKAKENREIFVNVKEKKTIKQSAEEFQKKNTEIKAINMGSKDKLKNSNNHDTENTPILHKHGPIKIKKIIIFLIIILFIGAIVFIVFNYETILTSLTPSFETAYSDMEQNFEKGYQTYQKIITLSRTPDDKTYAYIRRASAMIELCGEPCSEKIKNDLDNAEETSPNPDTAYFLGKYENLYGSAEKSEYWFAISEKRWNREDEEGE